MHGGGREEHTVSQIVFSHNSNCQSDPSYFI